MLYFNIMKQINKKTAFTLAEVLITLGVIGIVAALTIPAIMNTTKDQELKSKLKKNYSVMSQAAKQLAYDNGGSLVVAWPAWKGQLMYRLLPYLNYNTYCNDNSYLGSTSIPNYLGYCWANTNTVKRLDGNPGVYGSDVYVYAGGGSNMAGVVLNDGSFWVSRADWVNCNGSNGNYNNICGYIYVDVNGFQGPNQQGKDIFAFNVLYEGNVKPIAKGELVPPYVGGNADCTTNGMSCAGDYLINN